MSIRYRLTALATVPILRQNEPHARGSDRPVITESNRLGCVPGCRNARVPIGERGDKRRPGAPGTVKFASGGSRASVTAELQFWSCAQ
jgi:hypothetical protein